MKLALCLGLFVGMILEPALAQDKTARFTVTSADVGTTVNLTGKWLFKPGPPTDSASEVQVPVPQMLSRIQWWLDDSEDFKKWEQARLDALGFDTEKTDEGTYRITFDVPKDWPKDRHLWVEFDGVAMQCRTFCNDQPLGEHKGMFSRFSYDLTPHLKPGKSNTLSVWVSMEKIPPTSGNLGQAVTVNLSAAKVISMSKGMFGPFTAGQPNRAYDLFGIWQPARLMVRREAKIDDVYFQPSLTGATVEYQLRYFGEQSSGGILVRLTDVRTGEVLGDGNGALINPLTVGQVYRGSIELKDLKPKLWSPAEPNLYRLDATLVAPFQIVLDRWSHSVGFRTFEIKSNQLLLNGKPYWLRGANQLPYGKNPWDPDLPRKLIGLMHDGNQRFTRTHATPWNEAWLDAADEIGLAVSIEGIRPWAFAGKAEGGKTVMPPPAIFQHWLMENEDVVERCRNHPSVLLFTVGNEMLLRDSKNLEKWKLISEVTKQTRSLAPHHPIVVSSDYVRDPEFYEKTLKPAGIDDGDIDDMHRYTGWYGPSPMVMDHSQDKERLVNAGKRPIIGQEMSSGYPDLDTGLPVLRYTRDLLTPQAWVGTLAYPGNDPGPWLKHHAAVTKRWAEQLRYQRGNATSGFCMFSAECWFRHSYLPEAAPYPVYEAMKQAFAPIGLALETTQRRFWGGTTRSTNVFVTNDDEQSRDLSNLTILCELNGAASDPVALDKLAYFQTRKVEVTLKVPAVEKRQSSQLITRLMQGEQEISRTSDAVELFPKPPAPPPEPKDLIVVKPDEDLDDLAEGKPLREKIAAGATVIVFSPKKQIVSLFPDDLLDVKVAKAEFADWYPVRGTKLAHNLEPMDLKWWAKKLDRYGAFVAEQSHRLKPGGHARELIRFIPPHSYISPEKIPEQYRVVMSEIPIGKGRLWICDLDFDGSVTVDPAAELFARNLIEAAMDPDSTKNLPPVPSHEEMLKGVIR